MLRTGLLFVFVMAGAAPVLAEPPSAKFAPSAAASQLRQPIDLSAFDARRIATSPRAQDETAGFQESKDRWAQSLAIPGLSFGMAESDSGSRTAKARHFAIVRLQGVTLFGGNVGGSVDGRSAHLVLTWRTGP